MSSDPFNQAIPVQYAGGHWKNGKYYHPGVLSPETPLAELKQPHQMSPDEFASHPYAVFHSSHLSPEHVHQGAFDRNAVRSMRYGELRTEDERPDDFDDENPDRFGDAVHLGTEQAVTDRARFTVLHTGDDPKFTTKAYHHVFWYTPHHGTTEHEPSTDRDANNPYDEDGNKDYDEYYTNTVEDPGHISVAVRNLSQIASQADFVRKAIAEGKTSEVHPETLRRYRSGTLGINGPREKGELQALRDRRDQDMDAAIDAWRDQTNYEHENKYYQPDLAGNFKRTTPNWGALTDAKIKAERERTRLTRGPDMDRIRTRSTLDVAQGGGYRAMHEDLRNWERKNPVPDGAFQGLPVQLKLFE